MTYSVVYGNQMPYSPTVFRPITVSLNFNQILKRHGRMDFGT